MPYADVSDAIQNPDLFDSFIVIRRPANNRTDGTQNIGPPTRTRAFGVVTITGQNDLDRGPDYQLQQKTIQICTKFRLRSAADGFQPDEVEWHGDRFLVIDLEDYTGFGQGFVNVTLQSVETTQTPAA